MLTSLLGYFKGRLGKGDLGGIFHPLGDKKSLTFHHLAWLHPCLDAGIPVHVYMA